METKKYPLQKTEAEWLELLGEEKYRILREKGTERPFTGTYNLHNEKGRYHCAACNSLLFESNAKFDSGCGWPAFDQSVEGSIEYVKDTSYGMQRTEILCANCGSHLGHVFNDGPTSTGQRYCVNSLSMGFEGRD
ncbi:MAG: peptide-methionine (R)-S-oxide reductase MsrB [Flavobacteriaceae bacterium]